jgi:hypothetical protein
LPDTECSFQMIHAVPVVTAPAEVDATNPLRGSAAVPHALDPKPRAAERLALLWSVAAMSEATARLFEAGIRDRAWACAAVGEALWGVTLVDATLVRHHRAVYDTVLAGQFASQRPLIEATLAGLRFVHNQASGEADLARFVQAAPGPAGDERAAEWMWMPVPRPVLVSLAPPAQAWEMVRYEAYQSQLAGCAVEEIFRRATAFLTLAAANASALADVR